MRVAVVGKGGSGKTTTAAVVARTLAQGGHDVVALDCDTNPNLGISLGLGAEATERLGTVREALDDDGGEHASSWHEILERFGTRAPDDVRVAVVSAITKPDPECP